MADAPADKDKTNISPAPTDVVEKVPGAAPTAGTTPPPATSSRLVPDALSDGTVPTIIDAGESHHSVAKSPASITKIYRRADILTTLITAVGVFAALAAVGGAYYFFVARDTKKPTVASKVTTLDKTELSKLGSFFEGNSAGDANELLTISSSTLFKNRIATSSDLKVVGGAEVGGATILNDLTVNKAANFSTMNIKGALGVDGPANFRGAVLMGAGGSVNGNLSVSGTGSFGGTLSAGNLNVSNISVTGTFSLAGHLSMTGQDPTSGPGSEAGPGASTNVDGNDAAGTVTVNTGTVANTVGSPGGLLVRVTFRTPYPRAPRVIISPVGQNGATLQYYVIKTATGFTIGTASNTGLNSSTQYAFDYWVVQ